MATGTELAESIKRAIGDRRVAVAESCTAGRVATALAGAEFASTFFTGGLVAYDPEVKRRLLGVTAPSIYSEEAVAQMACGVARLLGTEVAVASSGVAGTEPEDGVPPGTVFIGTLVDGMLRTRTLVIPGSPERISEGAAVAALHDLLGRLDAATDDGGA